MTKKLLHKTSTAYLIYAAIILIISAPIFYYATAHLYLDEADETLLLHKKEFQIEKLTLKSEADIITWNKINRNIKLTPANVIVTDSIYNTTYYDTLDAEQEPYRELKTTIPINGKNYFYTEKFNLLESADLMKNLAWLYILTIILLLVGLYFITIMLSNNLWLPFYKTLKQVEDFEIDKNITPNFEDTNIEEFERLNKSFIKLIEKNNSIFKSQREFIENAAHELQTPLAIFKANIDTLMQLPNVTKAQAEIIETINENITRLNRLNKNLLLLSKIENNNFGARKIISIADIIYKNMPFFEEQAAAKNICITKHIHQDVIRSCNPILTEMLITNLLLNAVSHNILNGKIMVNLNNNKLIITNTGEQTALQNDKLFTRFSKTNSAEHGSGLGLAIVKKIAAINEWSITYSFNDNLHNFTLVL